MPLFMDELNAILAVPGSPRPKTEWSRKPNSFQRRILVLDRVLGWKAKGPPERKGRKGAERPQRALFRRVYEHHSFPHQRFVSPVKSSPLGEGAPRTYPSDSTINAGPRGATTTHIPTFEMFERQVNATTHSWVEKVAPSLHGHRTIPEGWLFDVKTKRLVRKKESIAPAEDQKNPPVKKQEEAPVNEADEATVASIASGSLTSAIPYSSNSSRKRRVDSLEGSSADDMNGSTPKRARYALPSEQLPPLAPLQLLSSTTTPVVPTIGGLRPFGAVLDMKVPMTMEKATAKAKPKSDPHRALRFRKEPQEGGSPTRILKNAPIYNTVEPCLKRKAEEMDIVGNFEDSRKSKKQMRNHHMDKADRANTINSTSEQLTKKSSEHHRGADQKPQNSNTPPTRAPMYKKAWVSTTLKDAMQKVQRNVQDAWDICAPFSVGLLKAVKPWESRKGVKKSGSSPSTTQPSSRRAVRPKPKPYVLSLESAEQSEQSAESLRLHNEDESKRIDSKDRHSSKQPTKPRCNVARPQASKAAEDPSETTIHQSKKPAGLALSTPATPATHKPVHGVSSFELIGPRPVFECGINGAHFLPLRFWQNDEDGNRGAKPIELPWPEFRGITVENLDWNSAEQIGWLNEWASRVLEHFGC
ncbi:uncharacterized protein LTHEOB_5936 [Lasiodiplodia theobromae]|uniref:uncharacterized protein n=1 Tax=Lasiodiplodia theobromae TaxID=45133 RepID=UPI0015C2C390|nr:uncharacterized protein LTHEOB_5936 [Lasiodiplodia theobromae]KAF4544927.1 hypothetical protein LTHEOB_5936 [Lasiodiplodia theobromae]